MRFGRPRYSAKSTRQKQPSAHARARKKMENFELNICTYCPLNTAFDPKLAPLRRLFFINDYRYKYVCVYSTPLATINTWWNFRSFEEVAGPKVIIVNDKHVYAMVLGLNKLRDAMRNGERVGGSKFKSDALRPNVTRSCRIARLYFDSQQITLTLSDLDYLARIFNVVQQQLRDYIVALPYVLSYVTMALISVTYFGTAPNAIKHNDYPYL